MFINLFKFTTKEDRLKISSKNYDIYQFQGESITGSEKNIILYDQLWNYIHLELFPLPRLLENEH